MKFLADDCALFRLGRGKYRASANLKSDDWMYVVASWDGHDLTLYVNDKAVVPKVGRRRWWRRAT